MVQFYHCGTALLLCYCAHCGTVLPLSYFCGTMFPLWYSIIIVFTINMSGYYIVVHYCIYSTMLPLYYNITFAVQYYHYGAILWLFAVFALSTSITVVATLSAVHQVYIKQFHCCNHTVFCSTSVY